MARESAEHISSHRASPQPHGMSMFRAGRRGRHAGKLCQVIFYWIFIRIEVEKIHAIRPEFDSALGSSYTHRLDSRQSRRLPFDAIDRREQTHVICICSLFVCSSSTIPTNQRPTDRPNKQSFIIIFVFFIILSLFFLLFSFRFLRLETVFFAFCKLYRQRQDLDEREYEYTLWQQILNCSHS